MKETTKMSRTAGQLEKMFRELNRAFFPGEEVQEPIITVQSTPRAYGHVSVSDTWTCKEYTRKELNISANWLTRPIENIAATMLHEMVHLYCMEHKIQDTSRGGTYHNKRFRDEAQRRGLIIDYDERIGWSVTSPSDALLDFILDQGWSEIMIGRKGAGYRTGPAGAKAGNGNSNDNDGEEQKKKPSSTRKLKCPECGDSCRVTKKDIVLICGKCMKTLIEV